MHLLLGRGAQVPVGAHAAVIAGLGGELAGIDSTGDVLHLGLRGFQFQFAAYGCDRTVLFQIVKD